MAHTQGVNWRDVTPSWQNKCRAITAYEASGVCGYRRGEQGNLQCFQLSHFLCPRNVKEQYNWNIRKRKMNQRSVELQQSRGDNQEERKKRRWGISNRKAELSYDLYFQYIQIERHGSELQDNFHHYLDQWDRCSEHGTLLKWQVVWNMTS